MEVFLALVEGGLHSEEDGGWTRSYTERTEDTEHLERTSEELQWREKERSSPEMVAGGCILYVDQGGHCKYKVEDILEVEGSEVGKEEDQREDDEEEAQRGEVEKEGDRGDKTGQYQRTKSLDGETLPVEGDDGETEGEDPGLESGGMYQHCGGQCLHCGCV